MARFLAVLALISLIACSSGNTGKPYVPPIENGTPAELQGVREVCVFAGSPKPGKEAQWANAKASLDLEFQRYFDRYLGADTLRVVACKETTVGVWLYDESVSVKTKLPGDCRTAPCFRELFRHEGGVDTFLPAFTEVYAQANKIALTER